MTVSLFRFSLPRRLYLILWRRRVPYSANASEVKVSFFLFNRFLLFARSRMVNKLLWVSGIEWVSICKSRMRPCLSWRRKSREENRYIRKSRTSSVLFFLYFFLLLSFQSPDSCKKGEKSRFFDTGKLCSSFVLRLIKPACVGRGGALV